MWIWVATSGVEQKGDIAFHVVDLVLEFSLRERVIRCVDGCQCYGHGGKSTSIGGKRFRNGRVSNCGSSIEMRVNSSGKESHTSLN